MSDEFKDIPVLDVDYHLREYDDIVIRLGNVGGFDPLAELCSEARAEIIRLRDRLEMSWAYDVSGHKISVMPGSIPDGIECRDATIKGLDEHIKELRAEIKELREALREKQNNGSK